MPKPIPERDVEEIESAVRKHPGGVTARQIAAALPAELPHRTLQYRLKHLVDTHRLVQEGKGRWAKYSLPAVAVEARGEAHASARAEAVGMSLSSRGIEIRDYLRQPPEGRRPVGYDRTFLDSYRPNVTFYLSAAERGQLAEVGKPNFVSEVAGTYAKQILSRLLIDFSWNSSRLEGNTYSLLDTRRLIEFGQEATGREMAENELLGLHDGNFARYQITPTEFAAWRQVWTGTPR